eukprot:1059537-Prymnesium_polylepis.2
MHALGKYPGTCQSQSREQAEAYTLIFACINAPLVAAVHERSDRYAASTHAVCEALEAAVRRQTEVAPLVYQNLTGSFGYATVDPAWETLAAAARRKGWPRLGHRRRRGGRCSEQEELSG